MESLRDSVTKIYKSPLFHLAALALIAALTLLAYSNTLTASFHFDDDVAINDPAIKHVTAANITALLHRNRPITSLSLMFNYAVGGLNVVGWHIFNLSFHIANSILVYVLILWTVTLPVFKERYRSKAKGMALFGALLFGVHPIQTEAVTYIIQRAEVLAAFFFLSTFLLFIRGTQKEDGLGYYVLALITSLCAIGSKEWAATLPLMLVLYDYLFVSLGSFGKVMKRWPAYALLFFPWVLAAYILSLYQGSTSAGFSMWGAKGITPWTYLLTSFNVIWTYVRLLVLPINQNIDYDYPLATTLFEFPTILSFIGHVVVVGAAFWSYKKKGGLLVPFGVAWFYVVLAPTQSFVPLLDLFFEHRVYMPSLGLFIVFVTGCEALLRRLSGQEWKEEVKTVIETRVVNSRKAKRKAKKPAAR